MRLRSRPQGTNNYFRVRGTVETFPFDDKDEPSVFAALTAAWVRAREVARGGTPSVLVWRRSSHPEVREMPVIGEPFLQLLN